MTPVGAQAFRASRARLRRFMQQPKPRRFLFVEACLRLVWARLLLRLLPFRQLTRFFAPPLRKTAPPGPEREHLRADLSWAIQRAADWLPGKTCCFPQGIAAQIMCRNRGIDSIMYYGAASDPVTGLMAHVWVQDGFDGVVGHPAANQYRVLARFPGWS